MELTALGQDTLGDMAEDSHGLGELAGFYRAANPGASDAEVFALVRGLVAAWAGRGWLQLGPEHRERAGLRTVDDLLPYLDGRGPAVVGLASDVVLPEVDLTAQAFSDVEWLRGAD